MKGANVRQGTQPDEGGQVLLDRANQPRVGLEAERRLDAQDTDLYRADMSMRNGENSFLKRWGHIHLEKIHEPVLETDGNAGEKAVLKNEEEDGTAPNEPDLPENPAEPAS